MSTTRNHSSTLHLQMGQEVLYLLLVTSLIANFVLSMVALRTSKDAREAGGAGAYSQVVSENKRLRGQLNKAKSELDAAKDAQKRAEASQAEAASQQQAAEARARKAEERAAQASAAQRQVEARFQTAARQFVPLPGTSDQPPIITLSEAEGYKFAPGSAEISTTFADLLRQKIVPDIIERSQRYNAQVVEVIGHTDGTSLRDTTRRLANLDDSLGLFLDPNSSALYLPYDNVGLGMARAVAVARALRIAGLPVLLDIHPLSAAYLISPKDHADPAVRKLSDASRRRIEIRVRRFGAN